MLQKEVVERIAAAPGGKDYGRLSVMLQWRYEIESWLDVPPESFDPPPRVESAMLRMTPRAAPAAIDPLLLREIVTSAFSQRRKLLRHTLGRWLEERGAEGVVRHAAASRGGAGGGLPRARRRRWLRARKTERAPRNRRSLLPRSSSGGRQPHRRVERAAHERHVRAKRAVRGSLRGLHRLFGRVDAAARTGCHFGRPLPGTRFL